MSVVSDTVNALKEALKLADDMKRTGEALKDIVREMRDHDRRLTRLEAQWETAMIFSQRGGGTPPRRLDDKG
jgi:RecA/RadA recombinase